MKMNKFLKKFVAESPKELTMNSELFLEWVNMMHFSLTKTVNKNIENIRMPVTNSILGMAIQQGDGTVKVKMFL